MRRTAAAVGATISTQFIPANSAGKSAWKAFNYDIGNVIEREHITNAK
jgi:hypothetical protein